MTGKQSKLPVSEVVRCAIEAMQNGDLTNYTVEGVTRELRFGCGVLFGMYLAGALTRNQCIDGRLKLEDAYRDIESRGLSHDYSPSFEQWESLDEH